MKSNVVDLPEADYWWQVMPALPLGKHCHEYHALRRVWGDHTINTSKRGRGYYRFGTEDNLTLALFQTWAIADQPDQIRPVLDACGVVAGTLISARWAYACEEETAARWSTDTGARFLIPDIVLHVEDESGPIALVFEVKRPGVAPTTKDREKLRGYRELPSLRRIARRHICFIVGEDSVEVAKALDPTASVLSWNDLMDMQVEALAPEAPLVAAWIRRNFARYGVGSALAPVSFADDGASYGSRNAYENIGRACANDRVRSFLAGSEAVEAFYRGLPASPPSEWLRSAPARHEISERKAQKTADRRLNRWGSSWRPTFERSVP